MKGLPALSYSSPKEAAERFHVSEELLAELNQNAKFRESGETVVVPAVANNPLGAPVASIVVDIPSQTVKAFDSAQRLVAFYPASVGSNEKPAPSGRLQVTRQKIAARLGALRPQTWLTVDLTAIAEWM